MSKKPHGCSHGLMGRRVFRRPSSDRPQAGGYKYLPREHLIGYRSADWTDWSTGEPVATD
jgi:hypothetical protein